MSLQKTKDNDGPVRAVILTAPLWVGFWVLVAIWLVR